MLTLNDVKPYLRLELTDTYDDTLISSLILASKGVIETRLKRTIDTSKMVADPNGGFFNTWTVPDEIQIAQMMLIAHWYDNRGIITDKVEELPFTVRALVDPHKRTLLA